MIFDIYINTDWENENRGTHAGWVDSDDLSLNTPAVVRGIAFLEKANAAGEPICGVEMEGENGIRWGIETKRA